MVFSLRGSYVPHILTSACEQDSDTPSPILYLIRHGEKPPKLNPDDEDPIGLSTLGLSRAQGLVQVFSRASPYNIGHIIAQEPKKGT